MPKRRIYDITNVMEGIGLIEKQGKNHVCWRGGQQRTVLVEEGDDPEEAAAAAAAQSAAQTSSTEIGLQVERLRQMASEMAEEEALLDETIGALMQEMHLLLSDREHSALAYVTQKDLRELAIFVRREARGAARARERGGEEGREPRAPLRPAVPPRSGKRASTRALSPARADPLALAAPLARSPSAGKHDGYRRARAARHAHGGAGPGLHA